MSAFAEFICIAIAIYLWESTLWVPLRGVVLRREWFRGKTWKVLDPRDLFTAREVGLVPLLPFLSDATLAPCQAPPLFVDPQSRFVFELASGTFVSFKSLTWSDLKEEDHCFVAAGTKTRLLSPRWIGMLKVQKERGITLEEALPRIWRLSLSPVRASREFRRWRRVSLPLRFYGPMITLGGMVGLPLSFVYLGNFITFLLGCFLWLIMAMTARHIWWLGNRVYPSAKAALRQDALLSLVVPFHAMRAMEIASVHAMGATHPVAMILATGDSENKWLAKFIRKLLHPLPEIEDDMIFSSSLLEQIKHLLSKSGKTIDDFDTAPCGFDDEESTQYCPRCHGLYRTGVSTCGACRGIALRSLN